MFLSEVETADHWSFHDTVEPPDKGHYRRGQTSQSKVPLYTHSYTHFHFTLNVLREAYGLFFKAVSMGPTKHKLPVSYLEGYALYAPFNVY